MRYRISTVAIVIAAIFFSARAASAGMPTKQTCKESMNNTVDIKFPDGSECFAGSDGTGTAHGESTGAGSFADSELSTHGSTHAVVTGCCFAGAFADHSGSAHATSMGNSQTTATADDQGTAHATAMTSSEADASAFGNCIAHSTATGTGSLAVSECESSGQHFNAMATGGGKAMVNPAGATCTASAGQTAKVTGNGHTCKAP